MGKTIKVIQNGHTTIMPNNPQNINRLQHFNHIHRKLKNASELVYTIIHDVSPEEEATIYPEVKPKAAKTNMNDRFAKMEQENSDLKMMLLKFMANQSAAPVPAEVNAAVKISDVADSPEGVEGVEQKKRGPGRPSAKTE